MDISFCLLDWKMNSRSVLSGNAFKWSKLHLLRTKCHTGVLHGVRLAGNSLFARLFYRILERANARDDDGDDSRCSWTHIWSVDPFTVESEHEHSKRNREKRTDLHKTILLRLQYCATSRSAQKHWPFRISKLKSIFTPPNPFIGMYEN